MEERRRRGTPAIRNGISSGARTVGISSAFAVAHLLADVLPGNLVVRMGEHVRVTTVEFGAKFRRHIRVGRQGIGKRIHGLFDKPAAVVHRQTENFGEQLFFAHKRQRTKVSAGKQSGGRIEKAPEASPRGWLRYKGSNGAGRGRGRGGRGWWRVGFVVGGAGG